jgi:two-component system sensor histidine kinase EvgS
MFQGTGLGLFICVSLCHQLQGFISCASTKDVGTAFHVAIPVDVATPASSGGSLSPLREEQVEADPILVRGPILIADDNRINLKVLHRALAMQLKKANLDIEILTAFGGAEAIKTYKEKLPSLIIIDYHMPEIDGIAAMTTIRGIEAEKHLPASYVMSYTADVTDNAAALLLSHGANEIMEKPPPKGFIEGLVNRLHIVPA